MTPFQRLCLATCAVIFALIVLGGVVRATDSGLGCPDWPRCHGSFIPRWEKHTLIEYGHRLLASVAGVMVLGIAVAAWRSYRRVPSVLLPALAALAFLLVQAGLGGVTVLSELPAAIVSVHLGTALALLFLLILVTMSAFARSNPPAPARVSANFRRLALLAAGTAFGQTLLGSYVGAAGYGLACNGWPLCNGQVLPQTDAASIDIHFLHRLMALILGGLLVALATAGWQRRRQAPLATWLAMGALLVYVGQALIGAAQIWTQLAAVAVVGHLAVASLLWAMLSVLNIRVHRLPELLGLEDQRRTGVEGGLAGATR